MAEDINALYRQMLGRDAGPQGLQYWSDLQSKGATLDDIRGGIANSGEFKSFSATNPAAAAAANPPPPAAAAAPDRNADLNRLYRENLGRDVGPAGLEYFTNSLNSGNSLDDVRNSLRASPEFKDREFINGMFNANLGRDAEPDAMQYYLGELSRGMGREKIKTNIQASDEFADYSSSQGQGQGGVNNAAPNYADLSDGFKYTPGLGGPTQGSEDMFNNSYQNLLGRDIQENERFAIGNKSVAEINNQLKASDEYKARTPQGFKGFSDPNIGQIFYEPGRPPPPVDGSYTPRGPDMAKALRTAPTSAPQGVPQNPYTATPRGPHR